MNSADLLVFDKLRPRLFLIAYRMLGMRADAEDIVQDAWLRFSTSGHDEIKSTEAWLVTITTRLSIDRLRSRKIERETYSGWWIPEPVVEMVGENPEAAAELASEVSVAMLWVLERLTPEERAAFLMRKVFDRNYDELAVVLGKSEAACRQLVHRAQERIRQESPRFTVSRSMHRAVLDNFMQAAASADRDAMKSLLSADVEYRADGGGKVPSLDKLLVGTGRVAGLYWAVEHAFPERVVYKMACVNGEPGLIRYIDGKLDSVQSFCIDEGKISRIYVVRNPDKLQSIPLLQ
ncbi:RNA polymerase sigma factor SigJ [Massilia sp. ST3]|uniref:RNA polymerase sigma factor SigJ n=1 Tax=Massilia sp. ST3 TaxID=2824903 RepID=UPI001B83B151|nr:RNA polymerase sigma factor SigJ [Massilia sp. ST3]MBQ5946436.1 RNA polymerase sigma factor SigJ [Massilia sp. ST3]